MKATGEAAQHNWVLDEKKIEEDAKMDGYYCIITSEIVKVKNPPGYDLSMSSSIA